jgi:putative SOS response-associated peptidase YedK
MCGRFTNRYSWREIKQLYDLTTPYVTSNFPPRTNIAPMQKSFVVRQRTGKRGSCPSFPPKNRHSSTCPMHYKGSSPRPLRKRASNRAQSGRIGQSGLHNPTRVSADISNYEVSGHL